LPGTASPAATDQGAGRAASTTNATSLGGNGVAAAAAVASPSCCYE